MQLLIKNVENKDDPREDNSDKKALFDKESRPRTANEHKNDWRFIDDEAVRTNIAYQMQYLEFQVYLYNDYRIYLTVESLMCKNIMAIIGGIVESALNALVKQATEKGGSLFDDRTPFIQLIDAAYDMEIIDRTQQNYFHALRKMRNLVHLSSIDYKEYSAYDIVETNRYIESLNKFISTQSN